MAERIKYCKKRDVYYQSLGKAQRFVVMCSLIVTSAYLTWRLGTFNPNAVVFSTVLYITELYVFITALLHLFIQEKLTVRTPPEPNNHVSVDVFITIYNEKIDILRRTVIAAKKMDYPHTLYILDDGNREEVRLLAEKLECKYITRTSNIHAKAGNLNNGLKHSHGEFIAMFDVDHAPLRSFLHKTLGYFNDEKVAFVQTPQSFYNLDSFQHRGNKADGQMWAEHSQFFDVVQRGRDYWNAVIFCGSCAVMRRSALERIGGFATGTVTEDMHTSIRLHKNGYKSVYHAESLAFGIAPAQMETFLKQRKRWGTGTMQIWRKEGIITSTELTIAQRINYFTSGLLYFDGWQRLVCYLTPGLVLFTGIMPLVADGSQFLYYFIPYLTLHMFMSSEIARGYNRSIYVEQYNMSLFHTFCAATLGLFTINERFVVTNKSFAGSARTYIDVLPQVTILLYNLIAIGYGIAIHYQVGHHLTPLALWINVFWASIYVGCAAAVVRFALRCAKFKRNDYRFHLPLKAELECVVDGHKQRRPIHLKNISGSGVMFTVDRHAQVKSGDAVSGTLHLPWDLPFTAHIRSVTSDIDEPNMCIVGCEFEWHDTDALEKLEGFLYGSNMELRAHNVTARIPTILERLFSRNSARAKAQDAAVMRNQNAKNAHAYAYEAKRGKI